MVTQKVATLIEEEILPKPNITAHFLFDSTLSQGLKELVSEYYSLVGLDPLARSKWWSDALTDGGFLYDVDILTLRDLAKVKVLSVRLGIPRCYELQVVIVLERFTPSKQGIAGILQQRRRV